MHVYTSAHVRPLRAGKDKGKKAMSLSGSSLIDLSPMLGDFKDWLPKLTIHGLAGLSWTKGRKLMMFVEAPMDLKWDPRAPVQVSQWSLKATYFFSGGCQCVMFIYPIHCALQIGPTIMKRPPVSGHVSLLIKIGPKGIKMDGQIKFDSRKRVLAFSGKLAYLMQDYCMSLVCVHVHVCLFLCVIGCTCMHCAVLADRFCAVGKSNNCIELVAGFKICKNKLTCSFFAPRSGLPRFKELKYEGNFKFGKSDKLGPLKYVFAPLENLRVFLAVLRPPGHGSFVFRLGIKIKFNMNTKALESGVAHAFLQFGISNPGFSVGGSVTMTVKVGEKSNYPALTVTLAYQMARQRLDLDGEMSGCWKDSFGMKGLSVCDVNVGISLGLVFPFLTRLSLGGTVKFSTRLQFTVQLHIDLLVFAC